MKNTHFLTCLELLQRNDSGHTFQKCDFKQKKEIEKMLKKPLKWKNYKDYKKRELFYILRTEIRRLEKVNSDEDNDSLKNPQSSKT
jgi:hypothetical protein